MDVSAQVQTTQATKVPAKIRPDSTHEVAKKFEAVFMSQTVNAMLDTIPEGSFGGGAGEDIWKSFLGNSIAEEIAESQTTGLTDTIETQIKAYQGKQ